MAELFGQLSAFTVFLSIAAVGFLILVLSFFLGEIADHLDFSADHDGDFGGPSFFSPRIISVFITAFGGFGAVGIHYGLSTVASSGLGFLSGLSFASVIFVFARFLYGQQASTDNRASDLVGRTARIIVSIPPNGLGQIRCQIGEELVDKMARSGDGQPVPENTIVKVEQILGEIVVVRPSS